MSNRSIYRKIAKKNGVTLKDVKKDMQSSINYDYKNTPNDVVTAVYQNQVQRKNEIPTVDEVIRYGVNRINKR